MQIIEKKEEVKAEEAKEEVDQGDDANGDNEA